MEIIIFHERHKRFSSAFWSWQSYKEFIVRASVFISCFSHVKCLRNFFSLQGDKKRVTFRLLNLMAHLRAEWIRSFTFWAKVHYFVLARLVKGREKLWKHSRLLHSKARPIVPSIKKNLHAFTYLLNFMHDSHDNWYCLLPHSLILFFLGITSILCIVSAHKQTFLVLVIERALGELSITSTAQKLQRTEIFDNVDRISVSIY